LTPARRSGVIGGLHLTPLSRARYRCPARFVAAMAGHYAKSGTMEQTGEQFGHQNPAHDFIKIERRRAAQPRIGS